MDNLRFVLIAVALFAGTFVGVSWASKGFPVMMTRVEPLNPDARVRPTFEESVKQGQRKDWENSKTSQGDNDSGRDQMRLTTIQAANAYALSPCDKTIKAAFIVSTSTYLRAIVRRGPAEGMFSTPMDMRVREAITAAINAGGITMDEFPAGTHLLVATIAGPGDGRSPCGAGRQADRRTR